MPDSPAQEKPEAPVENNLEADSQESASQQPAQEGKSRTQEQFEKLTKSNRELKEENEKKEEEIKKYKNVLDSLIPETPQPQQPQQNQPQQQPQQRYDNPVAQAPSANQFSNLNQQQVNDVFSSMIDADGYLDGNKLMQTLQTMNQRAMAAEQRAARVEEHLKRKEAAETESIKSNTVKEVHAKFPEVDPESDKFDPELWELVQNEMIGQMMQGKEDFMSATEKWMKKRNMTRSEKEQAETRENQKATINSVRPRSPMMQGYYETEEQRDLISKVRQGKKGALAEALRRHEESLKRG